VPSNLLVFNPKVKCLEQSPQNLQFFVSIIKEKIINSTEGITINFDYKRKPDEKLITKFGVLQCKVTYATGTFKNGNITDYTYLKSYYHSNYGFIKLEYDLINKEKFNIDLIEVKEKRI